MITTLPQIENIEIIELLGQGGMSVVYKARQLKLDRIVAVKVLSDMTLAGEDSIKRFQNEAKLTSSLNHPNIVKTISFGTASSGLPYLIMEYLFGITLTERLQQKSRLSLLEFKEVFVPILSALDYAHKRGLIHRDIKPGNIMLCKSGVDSKQTQVKLLDFGIGKLLTDDKSSAAPEQLTRTNALLGSPAYMSPEQCQAKPLDGRSDLYSLACVMYESLAGKPPFDGDSAFDLMQHHLTEEPPSAETFCGQVDLPLRFSAVLLAGLAKQAADRPQTASEYLRLLNSELERMTLEKVPQLKSPGKKKWIVPVGSVVLASIALIGLLFAWRNLVVKPVNNEKTQAATEIDFIKTEKRLRKELSRAESHHGLRSQVLLSPLDKLAEFYQDKCVTHSTGKKAIVILERILALQKENSSLIPSEFAKTYFKLGYFYHVEHNEEQAQKCLEKCIEIQKSKEQASNDNRLPDSLLLLASVYDSEKKYDLADACSKEALASIENISAGFGDSVNRTIGDELVTRKGVQRHSSDELMRLASYREAIAARLVLRRRYAEAEALTESAIEMMERNGSANDPSLLGMRRLLDECRREKAESKNLTSPISGNPH